MYQFGSAWIYGWKHSQARKPVFFSDNVAPGVAVGKLSTKSAQDCSESSTCISKCSKTDFMLWCIDSLIHWFIGWLIHWFVDSLNHSFFDFLIQWFADSLIHWFVGSLISCFTDSLIRWFIDSLHHSFIESVVHCFVASLTRWILAWLIDCLIDRLIHRFIASFHFVRLSVHWFLDSLAHWFTGSLVHWFIQSVVHGFFHVLSVVSQQHFLIRWCTSQLQHLTASTFRCFAFQKHSHTVGPLPIVVDFLFSKLLPRCGPGTTGNFDMVQTCSNRPGVKFVPRMWKTNPDATIEDLDGKSGPGATSTSDASDMSHLGRCLGTRHVKKQGMEDDPQPVMLRYEASLGRYPGYIGLPDKSHLVPQGSHEFCTRSRYFQRKWRFCDLCRMLTSTSMCLPRWWRWRPCWGSWREPGRSSIVRLGTSDLQQDILCIIMSFMSHIACCRFSCQVPPQWCFNRLTTTRKWKSRSRRRTHLGARPMLSVYV